MEAARLNDSGIAAAEPAERELGMQRELGILGDIAPAPASARSVEQHAARVVASVAEGLAVELNGKSVPARRAVSCLVRPEVGDCVLAATTDEGTFLLAVLSREGTTATLVAEGDLRVQVPAGRFSVAAKEGIDFATSERFNVAATDLAMHAKAMKVVSEELVVMGAKALVDMVDSRIKGSILEGVFERVSQRVKRSYRKVEEVDTVRAADLDYKADATVNIRSQNTVMTSKELIKADAEQIHFG